MKVKLTVSHTESQCLVFVVFICFECKRINIYGLGKAVVAVSWLRGTTSMFLSLKKSSIVCLNFPLLNFSSSSTNILFRKCRPNTLLAWMVVFDANFSLALSCQQTQSNPDIMQPYLCAMYSQFLAMKRCNNNIHEQYHRTFNAIWSTRLTISKQQSVCFR